MVTAGPRHGAGIHVMKPQGTSRKWNKKWWPPWIIFNLSRLEKREALSSNGHIHSSVMSQGKQ